MSVTFLHTSDWQIGKTFWYLNADGQARLDQARLDAIAAMGQLAVDNDCAFIVVAGDIFENNGLARTTVARALEAIKALPVPVYLLPGNHDPLTADSHFRQAGELDNVTILDSTGPFTVPGRDDVEIVAAPLGTKHTFDDEVARMLDSLEPAEAGRVRIAVGHGAVTQHGTGATVNFIDLERARTALADGLIDYLALGDTHSATCLDEGKRIFYSGAPEVTAFHDFDGYPPQATTGGGENNSGTCLVVTIDPDTPATDGGRFAIDVTEHHVGRWTLQAHTRDCNTPEDVDDFLSFLGQMPDKARTVIKYALQGTISVADKQRLEEGIAELEDTFAALFVRERLHDLSLSPSEDDVANLDLGGYARAALQELIDAEDSDAIGLLFRLAKDHA